MFKMNLNKYLILSLVILTGFGSLVANAKEDLIISGDTTAEVLTDEPTLPICDHNDDDVRNLSDVAIFASCAETFDANGDGVHDLADISLYTSNNQDDNWCATDFDCVAIPHMQIADTASSTLAICDHNRDGSRNLSDVSEFASCKDTFDANGDNVHDLSDISLYTSNNQDDTWCRDSFVCDVTTSTEAFYSSEAAEETTEVLAICDHNGDGSRNLSDVAMFAECAETFDANNDGVHNLADISEYAVNKLSNDGWCTTTFKCTPKPVVYSSETPRLGGSTSSNKVTTELEGEVLGEKIEVEEEILEEVCTYNSPDADVLGKTEWSDGSLIRGCGPEVYIIENQQKRHIKSLEELFNYIGQRINNVTDSILNLF